MRVMINMAVRVGRTHIRPPPFNPSNSNKCMVTTRKEMKYCTCFAEIILPRRRKCRHCIPKVEPGHWNNEGEGEGEEVHAALMRSESLGRRARARRTLSRHVLQLLQLSALNAICRRIVIAPAEGESTLHDKHEPEASYVRLKGGRRRRESERASSCVRNSGCRSQEDAALFGP